MPTSPPSDSSRTTFELSTQPECWRRAIDLAAPSAAALPKPGLCVHRNVVQVMSGEEIVAWLCRTCDAKLPAEWAVREEDL